MTPETLAGWGRFPRVAVASPLRARGAEAVSAAVITHPSLIARGNGRSYGDAALNRQATLSLLPSDRLLAFDPSTGVLTCEAGLLLADLLAIFVPQGWFIPVTPGTKYVTIGGMIAADVHGKNHHGAGSFGDYVLWLDLTGADGVPRRCSPDEHSDLFAATLGGMGLTGVITAASIRLIPIETAYIRQETRRAPDLDTVMRLFEANRAATYSVAWIDCLARGKFLGRSVLYLGEHAIRAEVAGLNPLHLPPRKLKRLPIDLPPFGLNRFSVGAFNALYYGRAQEGSALVDYDTYFYPLDALLEWNRLYGRPGFLQYQCVLPLADGGAGLRRILERVAKAGQASFLAVLKLFGEGSGRPLSFPMAGYTLALDFPANPATLSLALALDGIVGEHGGRLYLAKDSRAGVATLAGYPDADRFRALRRDSGAHRVFSSLLSERLGL